MTIRAGLLQLRHDLPGDAPINEHKDVAIAKHTQWISKAADQGVQVLCLQELFFGPYFAAEQHRRWYAAAEPVPNGPTVQAMQEVAKKHRMVLIVPVYEMEMPGVYY
ncbi:MAG: nitrilase-related carbon-nitrogen hydrolase, partial [Sulfobacillus sp.]